MNKKILDKEKSSSLPAKVIDDNSLYAPDNNQVHANYKASGSLNNRNWLNSKEAANWLGVSQPTLRKMRRDKLFTAHQYGRRFLYSKSELDAAVENL
ncbi:hypothetical protein ATX60_01030 [Oenococcus oeni]|uniref:helix-turn-helix domain-containing protein n=1 Tax=Oenococcus oeni TaxID=1247 RepID=UPI0008F8FEF4|nr:helix-turn-helix domain-containing protein [Oenococcus oeni]OIM25774.1 hypothetical protein ATX60_01030 [Oenococcus oeni]